MTEMERLHQLATVLAEEEPQPPAAPIPWHARNHNGGFDCCRFCGKLYTDKASLRRHQAQYCRKIGG
jgi:hypothetical protein